MIDTTVIIHGPLKIESYHMINQLHKTCNIVLCFPIQNDFENKSLYKEIMTLAGKEESNICITQYGNIINQNYNNYQNRWIHFFSVDSALNLCTTKYVIKIRSDEYYLNLEPFYSAVVSNPEKIITNEVFFRKYNVFPFHPSDHLVAGRVENMKEIFSTARKFCEKNENKLSKEIIDIINQNNITNIDSLCAEQIIGLSTILKLGKLKNKELDIQNNMKALFHIVKNSETGYFITRANSVAPHIWTNDSSYFDINKDVDDIENY